MATLLLVHIHIGTYSQTEKKERNVSKDHCRSIIQPCWALSKASSLSLSWFLLSFEKETNQASPCVLTLGPQPVTLFERLWNL